MYFAMFVKNKPFCFCYLFVFMLHPLDIFQCFMKFKQAI